MDKDTEKTYRKEKNGEVRLVSSSLKTRDNSVLPSNIGNSTVNNNLHTPVGGASFSVRVSKQYISRFSKNKLYALALIVIVRAYEQQNNKLNKFHTINSLHKLTGLHAKTIEGYLRTLSQLGLVYYKANGMFTLGKVSGSHKERNVIIQVNLDSKNLKNTQKALLAERFLNRLRQISFYKNAISNYHDYLNNPKTKITLKEHKKNLRWLRSHCKLNFRESQWNDLGWSFKSIASYLGTSIRTAFSIVKDLVASQRVIKENRYSYKKITSDYEQHFSDFTYIHNGYMVLVGANSYSFPYNPMESSEGETPSTPLSF